MSIRFRLNTQGGHLMRGLEGLGALWETLRSILPLTAILALFQLIILRKPIDNIKEFGIGFFY